MLKNLLIIVTMILLVSCGGSKVEEPVMGDIGNGDTIKSRRNYQEYDDWYNKYVKSKNIDQTQMGLGTQEDLIVNVGDRVFFAFDSSVLVTEAKMVLRDVSDWLEKHQEVTITIEGHCDERGTREYNLALGERRAYAVKSYLQSLGINRNRIATISYGKERPAELSSTPLAWSLNRRGVIIVN